MRPVKFFKLKRIKDKFSQKEESSFTIKANKIRCFNESV